MPPIIAIGPVSWQAHNHISVARGIGRAATRQTRIHTGGPTDRMIVATHLIASVRRHSLGPEVTSLNGRGDEIIAAVDVL